MSKSRIELQNRDWLNHGGSYKTDGSLTWNLLSSYERKSNLRKEKG